MKQYGRQGMNSTARYLYFYVLYRYSLEGFKEYSEKRHAHRPEHHAILSKSLEAVRYTLFSATYDPFFLKKHPTFYHLNPPKYLVNYGTHLITRSVIRGETYGNCCV
jgi:hypothetical protein